MSKMLLPGVPAPWFSAPALQGNPRYMFSTAAGRWIVLLMLGRASPPPSQAALRLVAENRALFDDENACFFGVTIDPSDAAEGRIAQQMPGIRWFLDYDRQVSKLYGAAQGEGKKLTYTPHWLLLDPMLRVRARAPLTEGAAIMAQLREHTAQRFEMPAAPVLVVPEVFPRELCRRLIDLYKENGGDESGFMREENGVTVLRLDHQVKRRADYLIKDPQLVATLRARMANVLRPMIRRAFQFDATRIERFIVACYEGGLGGHFRAHRDNTTKGTAHRKFACTINLNEEEFEGGELWFPEFGRRTYRAPTGGAVVFSCSLLHEAKPVTKGERYAFLPFLYDDEGARVREQNLGFVDKGFQNYRSGLAPGKTAAGKGGAARGAGVELEG